MAKISGGDKIPYEKPTCNLNLISKLQGGIEDIYILMSKTVVVVLVASSFEDWISLMDITLYLERETFFINPKSHFSSYHSFKYALYLSGTLWINQVLQDISEELQLENFSKSFSGFTVSWIYVQYLSAMVGFSVSNHRHLLSPKNKGMSPSCETD